MVYILYLAIDMDIMFMSLFQKEETGQDEFKKKIYIFLMTFQFEMSGSAASETDVIEGRVVDDNASIGTDASLHSANAVETFAAVIAPVSARVADSVDFTVV